MSKGEGAQKGAGPSASKGAICCFRYVSISIIDWHETCLPAQKHGLSIIVFSYTLFYLRISFLFAVLLFYDKSFIELVFRALSRFMDFVHFLKDPQVLPPPKANVRTPARKPVFWL